MASVLAAIPAFIASLPYLFQAMAQFMSLVTRLVALAEKNGFDHWMTDLEKKIDSLEKAKDSNEKLNAARDLARLLRGFN